MNIQSPRWRQAAALFAVAASAASARADGPPPLAAPATDISAPARAARRAARQSGAPATPSRGGERVLFDYWFTVTVNKAVHYEYYNDRAEIKSGRVVFQNHAWKREEDYINEEQLGVFAENDADLTPLFYNFHSTYRSIETTIDANVAHKEMTVRVRKSGTDLPAIKKMIPAKTFFSGPSPWLGRNLPTFVVGQIYPFLTVLEDNVEAEFATMNGQVRVEPDDELAARTHTKKITVNYREMRSVWWVDSMGAPLRIEMPLQKTVVDRVPREKARKFLDES